MICFKSITILTIIFGAFTALAQESPSLMPTQGPYFVSRTMFDWIDIERRELGTLDPNDRRELPVQVWYPAIKESNWKSASYRPRIEEFREAWGDETIEFFESVNTYFTEDAKINPDRPFPVLIFSHGWGSRSSSYTTLLSNLASYGYVVVGINHPYLGNVAMASGQITEPNDTQFKNQEAANLYYAQDVSFIVDQLLVLNKKEESIIYNALDEDKIVAAGHSSGFPAVSAAAVNDQRIKGLISFDSGVPKIVRREGLDVPILLMKADTLSYTSLFFRDENTHTKGTIYDVNFFRTHRGDFYCVSISHTTHSSAIDEYVFSTNSEEKKMSMKNHSLISSWVHAFIQRILFNKRLAQFNEPSSDVFIREIPKFNSTIDY